MKQGMHIDPIGSEEWYKNGMRHRDNDLPAVIKKDGAKLWYQNGELHRDNDLPAVDDWTGKYWYKNDMAHREDDKPAIEFPNGTRFWYFNDLPHRIGSPARCFLENDDVYFLDGTYYENRNLYWTALGKTYGLLIRDKERI